MTMDYDSYDPRYGLQAERPTKDELLGTAGK